MLDVVTIGSATLDIFLKSDQFTIDRHQNGIYLCQKYEGKIEAQELVMVSGGGATNAAVSYARKGLAAAPIIELGRDPAAEMILLDLAREKVDLSLVIQESEETTAVSVILLSGKGGNSIVTFRGASRRLTASDIPFDKLGMMLKPGGWIHLTSVGGDMELVEKVLAWGKEKNRKVFWNPGTAEIAQMQKGPTLPRQGWTFPNMLQLNRQETSEFFGIKFTDEDIWKAEHCPAPPETILIITDGARGGRVCHQGNCTWYKGIKTKMVDSTGAGDAFGSGFVAALMLAKDIPEAVEWGRKQAAGVVEHIGAKAGLLSQDQISNL
jgi:ribokinase